MDLEKECEGDKRKYVVLEVLDLKGENEWNNSGILDVTTPGQIGFCCLGKENSKIIFMKLTITVHHSTFFQILEEQSDDFLIKISNDLDTFDMLVYQEECFETPFLIKRKTASPFAWINPTMDNKLKIKFIDGDNSSQESLSIDFNKLELSDSLVKDIHVSSSYTMAVKCEVDFVKDSRIIKISNKKPSDQIILPKTQMSLNIQGISLSLISRLKKKRREEIFYILVSTINIVRCDYGNIEMVQMIIKDIYIDNMITEDQQYRVALHSEAPEIKKDVIDIMFIRKKSSVTSYT